jgi:E3 ubiquitin-protein ligase TRIP12
MDLDVVKSSVSVEDNEDVVNDLDGDEDDEGEDGIIEEDVDEEDYDEEEEEEDEEDEEGLDAATRRALELEEEDGQEDEEDEDEDGHYDDDMGDPYGEGDDGGGGFGSHLRAMAGYMNGLASKFRTLLTSIRNHKDPASQLIALQELSEVLSISNEDTLAGYFPTESFVAELIYLMGGPKPPSPTSASESSRTKKEREAQEEEDETMAAIAAAASDLEDNGEMRLTASSLWEQSRC